MPRAYIALIGLAMSFIVHSANAGPVIAIKAIGNLANSEGGGWIANPNLSPEEYAARAFTHTVMFDLDSCTLSTKSGLSGECTRVRDVATGPYVNFDSGWVTPLAFSTPAEFTFATFSISRTGITASNNFWYEGKPMPKDWAYPIWGRTLHISLEGTWDEQINNLSDLFDKTVRVKQGDQGPYYPNASLSGTNYETMPESDMILETGFEFANISFIPEPSSISLVWLAMLGLTFIRRHKVYAVGLSLRNVALPLSLDVP